MESGVGCMIGCKKGSKSNHIVPSHLRIRRHQINNGKRKNDGSSNDEEPKRPLHLEPPREEIFSKREKSVPKNR